MRPKLSVPSTCPAQEPHARRPQDPAVLAADANAVRWSEVHDVVIAGAGGAGLAAAVMAGSISKDVVVLEKTQDVGGNTRLADAFNAVDPAVQKPLGIEDSPELHARQMLETGRWCADPKLVETVATGAPRALAWLKELGVRFEPGVYQVYGSLWPRTHSPSEPEGSGYIRPLLFKCRELGVSIRTGTKVLRVIRNGLEGPVLGVEAERMNGRRLFIRARSGVVPGTTGDLIAPLEDIGAAAVGMDFFQLLPGSAEDGRFIGAASTVERMIFVNRAGERFIAEDSPSSKLSAAVLAQPGGIAFPILDANGYSAMRTLSRAMFDRALMRGDAFEANSIPELASLLQIPAEALVATVEAYNEAVETGHDPVGRRAVVLMHRIARRPFYGAKVTMCVNCTLGGIAITPRAEVLDRHGRVIPRLYAAGEVTGGVHGANYMGGNALSDVFTFGRIAGENAVQEPFA